MAPAAPCAAVVGHDWPLRSSLMLGPLPTAVPCARLHARHVLCEWELKPLRDSVELILSELMTNALAASHAQPGGPFPVQFWLLSDRKHVLILVWDASPDPPVRMEPDDCTEGGRGLMLVEALSAQWDWYRSQWDRLEGKTVWALLSGD